VADDVTVNGDEDTIIPWTPSVSDLDGEPPTCSIVSEPGKGSASVNSDCSSGTYAPNPESNGVDTFMYKANDGTDDSNLATVFVTVNPINDVPVASFTYTCSDLMCDFDATPSSDIDGTIVSYDWDFGDGSTGPGITRNHTYDAAGTYTVTLTVTDSDGATDTDSESVTVSGAAGPTTHVASITISLRHKGPNWEATAVVIIVDENGRPVKEATVTGDWDLNGVVFNDGATGTTNRRGGARIVSGKIQAGSGDVFTFTVTSVSHPDYTYVPAANVETSDWAAVP